MFIESLEKGEHIWETFNDLKIMSEADGKMRELFFIPGFPHEDKEIVIDFLMKMYSLNSFSFPLILNFFIGLIIQVMKRAFLP